MAQAAICRGVIFQTWDARVAAVDQLFDGSGDFVA